MVSDVPPLTTPVNVNTMADYATRFYDISRQWAHHALVFTGINCKNEAELTNLADISFACLLRQAHRFYDADCPSIEVLREHASLGNLICLVVFQWQGQMQSNGAQVLKFFIIRDALASKRHIIV
jgi:hypothetical protein